MTLEGNQLIGQQAIKGGSAAIHAIDPASGERLEPAYAGGSQVDVCLLYTSPSPRDLSTSRMPSSA